MIKTKSVYDSVETSDGKRFLVARYWPRGLSKNKLKLTEWIRDLAPSRGLLEDWKKERITWQQYELRYVTEMQVQHELISKLSSLSKNEIVTLLCFEKEDNPHCHRHLLKQLIERRNRGRSSKAKLVR